jgi:predicted nucleic acid-binding protein
MAALIDTGIFFGFYSLKDNHHMDSVAILTHAAEGKWGKLFISNHILDETLTLLKYKGLSAKAFIETFIESDMIQIIYADRDIESSALDLFVENYQRKGLSYTDAVSIVIAREFALSMLSYDARSFQGMLDVVGQGYWESLDKDEQKKILSMVRGLEFDE